MNILFVRQALLLVVSATLLAGCDPVKRIFNNSSKENIEPPKALVEFAPTLKVEKAWSAHIGKGAQLSGARLRPVYADGRLYVGSTNGDLQALDAVTGKSLWRKKGALRYSGGPSVSGEWLVVGTLDGEVQVLSTRDGSERWHTAVSSEVIAAPVINDDMIVVRSHDGRIYGLDASDGTRKWTYDRTTVPLLSLRGNSPPVVRDGLVFNGADNGKIVALRAKDGAVVWEQALAVGEGRSEIERLSDVDGILEVDSGIVYGAGYRGQIVALLAPTGRQLWTRDMSSYTGVSLSADQVFVVDADSNLWALDRRSGSSMWKQDALEHRWLSAPAAQLDYVIVGDLEGYIHWLNAADGKLVARVRLGKHPIVVPPLVIDTMVYVETIDGEMGAYKISKP